jgi:hypothetical protein
VSFRASRRSRATPESALDHYERHRGEPLSARRSELHSLLARPSFPKNDQNLLQLPEIGQQPLRATGVPAIVSKQPDNQLLQGNMISAAADVMLEIATLLFAK